MWKTVLAGAAAVAILGSSAIYAQDRAAPAPGTREVPRWQPSAEDISAFTDARVAALKAGLKLTPEQEKNWPAFEQAYRDLAKSRADQMRAFRDQRQTNQVGSDYMTRLQRRADALITRGNALKSFGTAAGPLYQSLDETQKHRFAALSRAMGPRHFHRFAAWHQQRGVGPSSDSALVAPPPLGRGNAAKSSLATSAGELLFCRIALRIGSVMICATSAWASLAGEAGSALGGNHERTA